MEKLIDDLQTGRRVEEVLMGLHQILSTEGEHRKTLKRLATTTGIVKAIVRFLKKPWSYYGLSDDETKTEVKSQMASSGPTTQNINGSKCKDPLMIVLALSCLYHISDCPPSFYCKYVDKDFLNTLLSYVIPDPALIAEPLVQVRFFQFGPRYSASVKKTLLPCNGRVKILMDEELTVSGSQNQVGDSNLENQLQAELMFYEPLYYELLGSSVEVKSVDVLIPSDSEDLNLADQLVLQGAAWPQGDKMTSKAMDAKNKPKQKNEPSSCAKSTFCEARITSILKGHFFWLVLGVDRIQQAEQVDQILQAFKPHLARREPKELEAVAAEVYADHSTTLVRARVMAVSGATVTVLDLDSGQVHQLSTSAVYSLPPALNLTKIPPLATLACLKGVLPMPLDARAPELAAGALGLIVRSNNVYTVHHLMHSAILDCLASLAICSDREVTYRALGLVVSLISYRIKPVREAYWHRLIPGVLATLRKCMQTTIENRARASVKKPKAAQSEQKTTTGASLSLIPGTDAAESPGNGADNTDQASMSGEAKTRINFLAETCVACLANSMFRSCPGKNRFYQFRGVETLVQAYVLYYNHSSIKRKCIMALANYVYSECTENPGPQRYRHRGIKKSSSPSKNTPQASAQVLQSNDVESDNSVESDEFDSTDVSSDALTESSSSVDLHRSCSFTSGDEQEFGDVPSKFYVRGSKVAFEHDGTHELRKTSKISPQDLTAIICGMLNTGRQCTIYLGLDPADSTVLGVTMTHDERDELRMSVDQLMQDQITPSILHLQFVMTFVPVMDSPSGVRNLSSGEEAEGSAGPAVFHLDHSYVMEIQVKPLPSIIYCCSGNECFYRVGGQTVMLDCQLIRQLLVLEEEAQHLDTIVGLQQELEKLRTEAAGL